MRNHTDTDLQLKEKLQRNAYVIQKKDLKACAHLLAEAFCDDPSVRYLLGGETMGSEDWRFFFVTLKTIYQKCVMISSDEKLNDLLTLFPPKLKGVPTFGFLASGGIALSGFYKRGFFGRSIRYEDNCMAVKRHFLLPGSWYCMFLVVSPQMQGQGRGKRLFQPVLNVLAENGHLVYLETHKAVNTIIYRHMGFETVDISVIPGTDRTQYAMLRKPEI
jgi:GNAT superfamily N-acetyltransferase